MTNFTDRSAYEQELINNFYNFEREAIINDDSSPNPYFKALTALKDGKAILEGLNEALEMAFN